MSYVFAKETKKQGLYNEIEVKMYVIYIWGRMRAKGEFSC
jgi:hypothetical protein